MAKRLLVHLETSISFIRRQDSYRVLSSIFNQCLSQHSKVERGEKLGTDEREEGLQPPKETKLDKPIKREMGLGKESSDSKVPNGWKWNVELDWLSKAFEPALQLYKWASATEKDDRQETPSSSHSLAEILTNLQRSKVGIQDWSFSDLTLGLYLIYLHQSSMERIEDINGVQVTSDSIVEDLIYHNELAKGAYKESAAGLARHSMLCERNILKFVKDSSVMRPGYYIGIDMRNKLVIFGIRGTHTVYDLITDMVTSSDQEVSFEGFSTHFGTAEAARWFLRHEIGTVKKYLEKHKGFRLRLVGHSLGGAAAALLAIMLQSKSAEELGFDPAIVSAVGFGTPPCVSKDLAESCSSFVSTVILQDDIIPRLSAASLARLRNEILQTNWMTVLERQDWRSTIDWVANAKQAVSLVQDVGRKLTDYANFRSTPNASETSNGRESAAAGDPLMTKPLKDVSTIVSADGDKPEELFIPGTMYFLKRKMEVSCSNGRGREESYTLWKREPGEHFQRIILSGNLISDHKCDNHFYALRDVLKGLPASEGRTHF